MFQMPYLVCAEIRQVPLLFTRPSSLPGTMLSQSCETVPHFRKKTSLPC